MGADFGAIRFSGKLRPSQVAASSVIQFQLNAGEKDLYVVAPPGSGKTILGLYVWSNLVRKPALVLSPNSAIQAQWNRLVSPGEVMYAHSDEGKRAISFARSSGLISAPIKRLKDVYI